MLQSLIFDLERIMRRPNYLNFCQSQLNDFHLSATLMEHLEDPSRIRPCGGGPLEQIRSILWISFAPLRSGVTIVN